MTPEIILIVAIGFLLGGILKGATGFGAPMIAVPLLAAAVDVRFAVVVFSLPNLVPNLWQTWAYRKTILPRPFLLRFVGAGMVGSVVGTMILSVARTDILMLVVAGVVFLYIGLRIGRPHWRLAYEPARKWAWIPGLLAGISQTAAGLSAPISITYLNAMRLERLTFMPTISCFFAGLGVVQIPMLVGMGFLDGPKALLSAGALLPLVAGMPLGTWLGRRFSPKVFDRVILCVLTLLALRLTWRALTGG
jgi:uncharacterized membrane protein YfcA